MEKDGVCAISSLDFNIYWRYISGQKEASQDFLVSMYTESVRKR